MEQAAGRNYEALTLGQRAGQLRLPAALNPYPFGTRDHEEWERARFNTLGAALARRAA